MEISSEFKQHPFLSQYIFDYTVKNGFCMPIEGLGVISTTCSVIGDTFTISYNVNQQHIFHSFHFNHWQISLVFPFNLVSTSVKALYGYDREH